MRCFEVRSLPISPEIIVWQRAGYSLALKRTSLHRKGCSQTSIIRVSAFRRIMHKPSTVTQNTTLNVIGMQTGFTSSQVTTASVTVAP